VLLLAQFVRPAKTNPAADPAAHLTAHAQVPSQVQKLLARSCNDCHSNQTTWPWYSNVAPASWLVVDDVNHGRKHLNLSTWGMYEAERRAELLEEMCEEVTEGKMPMPVYLVMHNGARVSSDEARALCEWSRGQAAQLGITKKEGEHRGENEH
jgi:hypothetical protein